MRPHFKTQRLPTTPGIVGIAAGGSNPTQAQISFNDAPISKNSHSGRGVEESAAN
jgi:hypothetical protein